MAKAAQVVVSTAIRTMNVSQQRIKHCIYICISYYIPVTVLLQLMEGAAEAIPARAREATATRENFMM